MKRHFLSGRSFGVAFAAFALAALPSVRAATFPVGDDQPAGVVLADGESLDNAAHISNNSVDAVANNGASPSIINRGTGVIEATGPGYAVVVSDGIGLFDNMGLIYAANGIVVFVSGADVGTFRNSGEISSGTLEAVWVDGNVTELVNSGTIMSPGGSAVYVGGAVGALANSGMIASASWNGVDLGSAGTFTNNGIISGHNAAVSVAGPVDSFNNAGTIYSDFYGVVVVSADSFTNSGRIYGYDTAVGYLDGTSTTVFLNTASGIIESDLDPCGCGIAIAFPNGSLTNHGIVRGSVAIVAPGDKVGAVDLVNSGTIIGTSGLAIDFGDGGPEDRDDFLRLLPGSQITGGAAFGPGFDTLDLRNYQGSATLGVTELERILTGMGPVWDDSLNSGGIVVIDDTGIKFASSGNYARLAGSLSNFIGGARNGSAFGGASSGPLNYAATPGSPAAAAAGDLAAAEDDAGARVWGAAFGAYGANGMTGNAYTDILGGLVAGAHIAVARDSLLGGVVSVSRSHFATIGQGQTIATTTVAAGLYGETGLGGLSLDYALLAGAAAHHSDRRVASFLGPETASADFASWFWSPEVGLSIPVLEQQTASAAVGFKVRYVGGAVGAYAETGSTADLSVPAQSINILEARAELMAEVDVSATEYGPVLLVYRAGVLAQSNLGGATLALGLPGGATVNSVSAGTTAAGVFGEMGLEAPLGESTDLSASLGGELRSDGFRTVAVRAGVSGSL